MKSFRDIRVIPVVLIAILGLAVLKVVGLVIDGGYVFDYDPQSNKRSWAQVSPSERAILERLQARRQELETRAREIDIRESLLKAAEKRIESKVEEMKAVESRIATATE